MATMFWNPMLRWQQRGLLGHILISALPLVFLVLPYSANAQKDLATKTVVALHTEQRNAYDALQYVAFRANIVIGVSAILSPNDERFKLDFPGGTVSDLMNTFHSQASGLRWQQNGNIIHVSSSDAGSPLANVVLNYPGAREKNRLQIWTQVRTSPEVKNWLRANRCREIGRFSPYAFLQPKNRPDAISISPGSMTLAQLLDKVATQTGVNFWAVLQTAPTAKSCHVSIMPW
ncbi:MAG TPA: hypothetical protein VHX63_16520 [Acidobacteriaceae bacterium]|jgi:hypothetical protein|nr:hypothetical protein [Acidobacteriaceae bacterium]